ncbi:hypothetical protein ACNI3Q_07300 [Sphingomonas sp. FW199]|uniref:hypothetical protein n=1 Tax=Sphingomonas sp. FW199 TaxID=3400217 RepID=UPI003CEE757D
MTLDPKWLRIKEARPDPSGCPDFSVMLVGIVSRQAASPTARVQARLSAPVSGRPLRPADGRFRGLDAHPARVLRPFASAHAGKEVKPAFTVPF